MTNEEKLKEILRETFPKVIFLFHENIEYRTKGIVFSEEWANEEYKENPPRLKDKVLF